MIGKGSKLYSVLFLKCPRCHKGKFLESHPYDLSRFGKVKDRCPECDLNYKIEPSFYYGSMYVSYAVGIAVAVAAYVLTLIFSIELSIAELFGVIAGALVLTMPWIGSVSKSIWANIFMNYDAKIAKEIKGNSK